MMKFFNSILSAGALAITLVACDEIKVEDRFIELPAVESQRVVLLEEYTGQKCINCPEAHKVIEGLEAQYPDNFIAVGIHCGGDAFSYDENRFSFGLRNDEGENYYEAVSRPSLPAGVVNRTSGVTQRTDWAGLVRDAVAKPANMELAVSAAVDGENIAINTLITPYENLSAYLQLWIVEDNIVARQYSGDEVIKDYVHKHVFRATVNGTSGEAVTLTTREPQELSNSIALKEKWNVENLSVVAFVYDASGVLQAAKCHVAIPEQEL